MVAVDDEGLALNQLLHVLGQVVPTAEVRGFTDPEEAMDYLTRNPVDVLFLDIEMWPLGGLALAKRCKELRPTTNLVFVTGHSKYMADAFRLHASGYLMKPVRERDLRAELDNLRFPPPRILTHRVRVQTFGNFEVFVDGKPLDLPRAKSKECLAYLVDRKGARVTVSELTAVLWEDRPNDSATQNSVHQAVSTLLKALKGVGAQDIIIKSRREIAIDPSKIDCDYFSVLGGDLTRMNAFAGEYMTNYSWAEFTLGQLVDQQEEHRH